MNGERTKYYEYKATSGRINIPKSVAKTLNWTSLDEINIIVKTIDNQIGLFLFKKNKDKK